MMTVVAIMLVDCDDCGCDDNRDGYPGLSSGDCSDGI